MSEKVPSAVPEGPVVLHPGVTRRDVEAARQTPQGRMHGVVVVPAESPAAEYMSASDRKQ